MPHNIPAFFDSYVTLYNRALGGENVFGEIMDHFSPRFIAAGPEGVSTGKQGATFRRMLDKACRFYRQIGTKKITAKRVEVTRIDAAHSTARVSYCADHVKPDGSPLKIEFEVTYFVDMSRGKPKIFGFVAGDEMALYRQHGLIPEKRAAPKQRPRPRLPESDRPGDRQRLN